MTHLRFKGSGPIPSYRPPAGQYSGRPDLIQPAEYEAGPDLVNAVNVALTLGSRGGVFIGGGIVPRLGDYFFKSQFRARFEAKGRLHTFVHGIPTLLITDTLAALSGASLALEQADA